MGDGIADWDGKRCPRCGSGTLVATVKGVTYRHCSFIECDWGLGAHDVIVLPDGTEIERPFQPEEGE